MAKELLQMSVKLNRIMQLPQDFEVEIMPYVSDGEPTPKEKLIERVKERAWKKENVKSVLNLLFAIPCKSFFRGIDGHIYFA